MHILCFTLYVLCTFCAHAQFGGSEQLTYKLRKTVVHKIHQRKHIDNAERKRVLMILAGHLNRDPLIKRVQSDAGSSGVDTSSIRLTTTEPVHNDNLEATAVQSNRGNNRIDLIAELGAIRKNRRPKNVISFTLPAEPLSHVTNIQHADLYLTVVYNKECNTSGGHSPRRRIKIELFDLNRDRKYGRRKRLKITSRVLRIRRTDRMGMRIPPSVITRVLKTNHRQMRIRVRCYGCSDGVKIVLNRRRGRRKRGRACRSRVNRTPTIRAGVNETRTLKRRRWRKAKLKTLPILTLRW